MLSHFYFQCSSGARRSDRRLFAIRSRGDFHQHFVSKHNLCFSESLHPAVAFVVFLIVFFVFSFLLCYVLSALDCGPLFIVVWATADLCWVKADDEKLKKWLEWIPFSTETQTRPVSLLWLQWSNTTSSKWFISLPDDHMDTLDCCTQDKRFLSCVPD